MKLAKKVAIGIGSVSIFLASAVAPYSWYTSIEHAEDLMVKITTEESRRIIRKYDSNNKEESLKSAVHEMTGGLYEIAEVYNKDGKKLAEHATEIGVVLEAYLPKHNKDMSSEYESMHIGDKWIIRIFVPLSDKEGNIIGKFEGVRLVPYWHEKDIKTDALSSALIAVLCSLVCGLMIYPVVIRLSKENEFKTREVLDSHISMMEALGRAIAKRDSDTGAHNYRVAWISSCIAERMNFSRHEMQALIAGSFLHDVGKIGISDNILLKPGKLTEEEYELMKTHVNQGSEIVQGMGFLDRAWEVVSGHHEKWDGSGYPRGLRGKEIPIAARIFAVSDVFDALTSKRPYKEPFPYEQTMEILEKNTGSHFDPEVMNVFRLISKEIYNKISELNEEETKKLLEEKIQSSFWN